MKDILFRLLMAAVLTLAALALSAPAHGQQADKDQTPTDSKPQGKAPESRVPSENPAPRSNPPSPGNTDDQTQDELAFTGRIEQGKKVLVLKDPITKLSYQLSDPARARKFIGKQVKVTGKLEMKSNTIEVNRIDLVQ
jgi:hypothetical protein